MLAWFAFLAAVCGNVAEASDEVVGSREAVRAKTRTAPEYPSEVAALPLPQTVTCVVRYGINEQGTPETIDVPEPCPDVFRTKAEAAAWQWTFYPYLERGTPMKATFLLTVAFKTPPRYVDLPRSVQSWPEVSAHLHQVARRRNAWGVSLSTPGFVGSVVGGVSLGVALSRTVLGEPPRHAYEIAAVSLGVGLPLIVIGGAIGAGAIDAENAASNWNEETWMDLQAGFNEGGVPRAPAE
jgi:hypothetical protein